VDEVKRAAVVVSCFCNQCCDRKGRCEELEVG
jgi:hypothetical protein